MKGGGGLFGVESCLSSARRRFAAGLEVEEEDMLNGEVKIWNSKYVQRTLRESRFAERRGKNWMVKLLWLLISAEKM